MALCIATFCVAQTFLLQKPGEQLVFLAQQAAAAGQNGEFDVARQQAEKLQTLWQSAGQRFGLFVGYDDLRLLELAVARLPGLCTAESANAFLSECAAVEMQMRRLLENQQVRWCNIL